MVWTQEPRVLTATCSRTLRKTSSRFQVAFLLSVGTTHVSLHETSPLIDYQSNLLQYTMTHCNSGFKGTVKDTSVTLLYISF